MSGIIGHTLYAEMALRRMVKEKRRWASILMEHRPSFHAGAYIGSDIQVMPEAVCVDTGCEVGFGTVPLEASPLTGGRVRRFRLDTPEGPLTANQVHERFYGRSHLIFGWRQIEQVLRIPWDHLPDYFAAVIHDLSNRNARSLAYTLGWIVHVVSDSLIKGQQNGIELHLLNGRYTAENRPVQDLISFHDIGIAELQMDWNRVFSDIAKTPVEEIQFHYMRVAEPSGELEQWFPEGWQMDAAPTLRCVLAENRRYLGKHAEDELAAMRLVEGDCNAAIQKRCGMNLHEMREAARRAGFRAMLDVMTEHILKMLEEISVRV
jgi:hypothetical protein